MSPAKPRTNIAGAAEGLASAAAAAAVSASASATASATAASATTSAAASSPPDVSIVTATAPAAGGASLSPLSPLSPLPTSTPSSSASSSSLASFPLSVVPSRDPVTGELAPAPAPPCVRVAPVALLAAFDHWLRRSPALNSVCGLLLGSHSSLACTYSVSEALPLPLSSANTLAKAQEAEQDQDQDQDKKQDQNQLLEPAKDGPAAKIDEAVDDTSAAKDCDGAAPESALPASPMFDFDLAAEIVSVMTQLNPGLFVVGWYSTGLAPDASAAELHELIDATFVAPQMHAAFKPIHLMFDPTLLNDTLAIKAHVSMPIFGEMRRKCGSIFQSVAVAICPSTSELAVWESIGQAATSLPEGRALIGDAPERTHRRLLLLSSRLNEGINFASETALRLRDQREAVKAHGIVRSGSGYISLTDAARIARMGAELNNAVASSRPDPLTVLAMESEVSNLRTIVNLMQQGAHQMAISEKHLMSTADL